VSVAVPEPGEPARRGEIEHTGAGAPDEPDWIILGFKKPGGVVVMASQAMEAASLVPPNPRELREVKTPGGLKVRIPRHLWRLLADFAQPNVVHGDSYRAAMASLTEFWTPPE
jgi:hypothetical protein